MRSLIPTISLLHHFRLYPRRFEIIPRFKVTCSELSSSNSNHSKYKEMESNIFKGKLDRFGGIVIQSEDETCSATDFPQKLQDSLASWKEAQKRGIWFKVHLNHSDWVPVLAQNGFKFHHAKEDFVMMYLWLPKTENCQIPSYATTMIGAGAVVVNDNDEVLVVKEKFWNRPHWKLPGGFAEPGENIVDAAIREVFEETNILTQFKSMLSFRHSHNTVWGCSDLYMVVHLKPLSTEIKKCDREIEEAKWMPIEEYIVHPDIHELNRFCVKHYLEVTTNKLKVECTHGLHPYFKKPYAIYYAKKDEQKEDEDTQQQQQQEENK